MVITDGFKFADLVELQEVIPLNHDMMPNFKKYALASSCRRPSTRQPVRVPWASGMTGIAWNTKYIKEPITSMDALWDPKYAGKIGMMQDPQELANFGLFKAGIDPDKSYSPTGTRPRRSWTSSATTPGPRVSTTSPT